MPENRHLIKRRELQPIGDSLEDIRRLACDWLVFTFEVVCLISLLGVVLGFDELYRFFYWIRESMSESIKR
jgi:hypothetical protein